MVFNNILFIVIFVGFFDLLKDLGGWEVSFEWMDVDNLFFLVVGWKLLDVNLVLEIDLKVVIFDEFIVWDEY